MNEPLAYWRELQAGIADSATWTQRLLDQQRALGFVYHDKPAMIVAEPAMLTETDFAADQAVSSAVLATLAACGQQVLADRALQDRYIPGWLDEVPDADLFTLPAGYPDPIVFGRLDGVRTADGLQVLEFNGGLPGGVFDSDVSAALMSQTDISGDFAARFGFRTTAVGQDLLDVMVKTWHDFGGTGLPFTVMALPRELTTVASRAITYLCDLAAARNIEIQVADPGEIVYSQGRARLNGQPIDVLVRAFFTPMLEYLGDRLDGIKAALRAESLCMITSLQSGLFGMKSLFAMATDPAVDIDVTPEQLTLARAHLPWTRLVAAGRSTDPGGSAIDLLGYLAANREQSVIKPTDGYGGSGVELGWMHTTDSWAAVIDRAAAGGHVAQQRVPIVTEEYSVLEEGFPLRGFNGDVDPLMCGDTMAGYAMRLAPEGSWITNVSGGASGAPVFILED